MNTSFSRQRKPYGESIVRLANRVAVCLRKSEVSIDFQKVLGQEVFSPERSLNQPKATRVCILSINQSNRSISVGSLFLFRFHTDLGHTKIALTYNSDKRPEKGIQHANQNYKKNRGLTHIAR